MTCPAWTSSPHGAFGVIVFRLFSLFRPSILSLVRSQAKSQALLVARDLRLRIELMSQISSPAFRNHRRSGATAISEASRN